MLPIARPGNVRTSIASSVVNETSRNEMTLVLVRVELNSPDIASECAQHSKIRPIRKKPEIPLIPMASYEAVLEAS